MLSVLLAFVVVFGVTALAAVVGWREGMSRRPQPDGDNPGILVIGTALGLIGSFLFVVAVLLVLALVTITVTILRSHRQRAVVQKPGGGGEAGRRESDTQ